jgi:hypothetical protein
MYTVTIGTSFIGASSSAQPQIIVDGGNVGAAPVTVNLTPGQHTISCGPVSGFTATPSTIIISEPNTGGTVICDYTTAVSAGQTTLTITLNICYSIPGQSQRCIPDGSQALYLYPAGVTPAESICPTCLVAWTAKDTGIAIFNVPQNSVWTVYNNMGGYGVIQRTYNIGTTPITDQFTIYSGGLNFVFESVLGLPPQISPISEIALSLILTIIGLGLMVDAYRRPS